MRQQATMHFTNTVNSKQYRRKSPDSFKNWLDFLSCLDWRNFINVVKERILDFSGLLVNPANVLHQWQALPLQ